MSQHDKLIATAIGGVGGLSIPASVATDALKDQTSQVARGELSSRSVINVAPSAINLGAIFTAGAQGSPENGGMGWEMENGFSYRDRGSKLRVEKSPDMSIEEMAIPILIGVIGLAVIWYVTK